MTPCVYWAQPGAAVEFAGGGANPAARHLGNYRGTGGNVPVVNRTFEWGAVIATFLAVVPRHCARLTNFLHPKSRSIDAVLLTLKPMTLTFRRLRRAGGTSGDAGQFW